jgi:hypothetical protein
LIARRTESRFGSAAPAIPIFRAEALRFAEGSLPLAPRDKAVVRHDQ